MKTFGVLGKDQAFWQTVEAHEELSLPGNNSNSSQVGLERQRREVSPAPHELELAIEWAHLGGH